MKVVLMAGGKGTRISSVTTDVPKPMIEIEEKPILEHEIECLREQGFTDIIITVSHLGNIIMDYFGDGSKISPATQKPFGVSITYFCEAEPLGNVGALYKIRHLLDDDFLLLIGDAVFNIDFNRFVAYHNSKGALATIFTHPNSHPYDSGLVISDEKNAVISWLNKEDARPQYYKNRVNAGLHIINPKVLDIANVDPEQVGKICDTTGKRVTVDLDRQLLKPLVGSGRLFCYDSPEYVKDMGTPERLLAVRHDFEIGIVNLKNFKNRQKAIFLDRDGTLNKYVGFLKNIDDFSLIQGAAKAVKKMNDLGYLCIVVTNQPVIARGDISYEELQMIHNKMEMLLGLDGAYLDAIYFCPHHPDKGFEGEVKELKIKCECRKPKPGMILRAAKEYNVDLSLSWMIGDSKIDVEAGKTAGCKTALISESDEDYGQNLTVKDLFAFSMIL